MYGIYHGNYVKYKIRISFHLKYFVSVSSKVSSVSCIWNWCSSHLWNMHTSNVVAVLITLNTRDILILIILWIQHMSWWENLSYGLARKESNIILPHGSLFSYLQSQVMHNKVQLQLSSRISVLCSNKTFTDWVHIDKSASDWQKVAYNTVIYYNMHYVCIMYSVFEFLAQRFSLCWY